MPNADWPDVRRRSRRRRPRPPNTPHEVSRRKNVEPRRIGRVRNTIFARVHAIETTYLRGHDPSAEPCAPSPTFLSRATDRSRASTTIQVETGTEPRSSATVNYITRPDRAACICRRVAGPWYQAGRHLLRGNRA
ncbi:unnamed protein product [Trichogramma brassicae]|uniref:Uncharacterized protein n=1 Tax=Trichogramma brassicae TaxID=86971 RepID=A0A6H5I7C6_9HYME|nr:unnamed protein product [Trichogramma brassicae]